MHIKNLFSKWLNAVLILSTFFVILVPPNTLYLKQFYENIEAQICCELFPKTLKNIKLHI